MKTKIALLTTSILVFFCSVLGIFQAMSLSAEPNYSRDRLLTNLEVWGVVSVVSFVLSIYLCLKLFAARR
jgi:hypothetical protein